MIIVRIAEGAWQHAGARFSEWVGTVGLIGWGLMLFNEPGIFAKSPSFSVMARWADQAAWANILLAAGAFRFLALVLNGTLSSFRKHTPTIRFIIYPLPLDLCIHSATVVILKQCHYTKRSETTSCF